ncbi:undecaprenyldiphospho-muramoylpentapeptide beta-N-acetylglucosaminyltransferase [Marinicrinis sediminis]|uniref:UDP-N-acetylglucosamine--N-acetylmuramyl-(pentapeptide) pyrophosphoryl-undecaprenol N-acetylglucosamine transferase n=1 Tax=Marinicrinis sediminis TaxID=1652465 RepID=A0ABW5REI6_9BACL
MFTGGGTAGHVTVNLALIPEFQADGWETEYMGSVDGIEKQLIQSVPSVPYYGISTGKLRRYMDWKNVKDPFRVMKGVLQAFRIMRRSKPDVLFSKGGFVTVPVIIAAWLNRVPVVIHESDLTPGLANKIAIPLAEKIAVTFPETMDHVKKEKAVYIGGIVRNELKKGSALKGLTLTSFTRHKPVMLIMGGSQGSKKINQMVRDELATLTESFQIIHICGKGQVEPQLNQHGYCQFEYVNQELADLLAATDIVVSRAGSNSIFEFLSLRKPMVLIPLSRQVSRGDQILNAQSFEKLGYAKVLDEDTLIGEQFVQTVMKTYEDRHHYLEKMEQARQSELQDLIQLIEDAAKSG